MTRASLKPAFGFVLFFGLFYIEPVSVGPTTIAVLWKAFLMLGLIMVLINRHRLVPINKLTAWGLLFVVSTVLNESLFLNPVETISFTIKNAFIPVLYGFLLYRAGRSDRSVDQKTNFLRLLSLFVVLSVLPFLTGLVSPMSSGYDLSLFQDLSGAAFGFIGIFQNAHGASITLAVATGTIVWSLPYIRTMGKKLFYMALILIGAVALVLTLVRTGAAMFAVMIFFVFVTSRKGIHLSLAVGFAIIGIGAGVYLFETNHDFRMRLLGENIYTVQQSVTLNQIGSGRLQYWTSALENFFSAPFVDQIFGFGPTLAKDYMQQATGLRIYAHNGLIDIVQFYGYFGVFAYGMMLFYIFRIVFALKRTSPYFLLGGMHLFAYLTQMAIQGERFFLADLLFALVLVSVTVARPQNHTHRPSR